MSLPCWGREGLCGLDGVPAHGVVSGGACGSLSFGNSWEEEEPRVLS